MIFQDEPVNPVGNLVNPVNETRFGLRCHDYDPNRNPALSSFDVADFDPRIACRRVRRRERNSDG